MGLGGLVRSVVGGGRRRSSYGAGGYGAGGTGGYGAGGGGGLGQTIGRAVDQQAAGGRTGGRGGLGGMLRRFSRGGGL